MPQECKEDFVRTNDGRCVSVGMKDYMPPPIIIIHLRQKGSRVRAYVSSRWSSHMSFLSISRVIPYHS
jgi:hypothetical protein